jgi:hypothetical protein
VFWKVWILKYLFCVLKSMDIKVKFNCYMASFVPISFPLFFFFFFKVLDHPSLIFMVAVGPAMLVELVNWNHKVNGYFICFVLFFLFFEEVLWFFWFQLQFPCLMIVQSSSLFHTFLIQQTLLSAGQTVIQSIHERLMIPVDSSNFFSFF